MQVTGKQVTGNRKRELGMGSGERGKLYRWANMPEPTRSS